MEHPLVAALWQPSLAPSARTCVHCARAYDNGLVDEKQRFWCRRCYEPLPDDERLRFDPSFTRPPALDDYRVPRISVCALYGDARVYCIIWALQRRLPRELVRAIVKAPIERVAKHSVKFFGQPHDIQMYKEDDIQGCMMTWHGSTLAIQWRNERFDLLLEDTPPLGSQGICFSIQMRENGMVGRFDEYTGGERPRLVRVHWYEQMTDEYVTHRELVTDDVHAAD